MTTVIIRNFASITSAVQRLVRAGLTTLTGRAAPLPSCLSRRRLVPALVPLAIIAAIALPARHSFGEGSAAIEEYRLGPQDKVRLRVYAWRPSRDEVFEWTALNAEFIVNAAGRLALPLLGEIPAAGMTTVAMAHGIGEQLRERLNLIDAPDASIEIVQFRPFYVTGQVDKPGEYPYRPGLTVLQAAAIAGGPQRMSDQGLLRLEREAIAARGDLHLYSSEIDSLLTRVSRLNAELDNQSTISFPSVLTARSGETALMMLMTQEELIHRARRQAFETEVAALQELEIYLKKEAESLGEQIKTHDKQIESMRKDVDAVKSLVAKGLAVTSRQNVLERAEAQLMGDRLRLEGNLMKARQEASRTGIAILDLRNKRGIEVAAELRTSHGRLEELARKIDTTQRLLYESEVIAPIYASNGSRSKKPNPTYIVVRNRGGHSNEIAATEGMLIEPGDTVKIELPLQDYAPPSTAQSAVSRSPDTGKLPSAVRVISHEQLNRVRQKAN